MGLSLSGVTLNAGAGGADVAVINDSVSGNDYQIVVSGFASSYLAWGGTTNAVLTNSIVFPKASAGLFCGGVFYNPNSSIVYVQVLNLATGGTLGTTVPIHVIALAPNEIWNEPLRNLFASSGIAVAATTTPTGSGAPSTGISGEVFYL